MTVLPFITRLVLWGALSYLLAVAGFLARVADLVAEAPPSTPVPFVYRLGLFPFGALHSVPRPAGAVARLLFTAAVVLLDNTCRPMDPRIRVPGRAAA